MTTKATPLHLENDEVIYLFNNPNVRDERYWKFIRMIALSEFPPEGKLKFTARECVGLYCLECNLRLTYQMGSSNSVRRHMHKIHPVFLREYPPKLEGPKKLKRIKRSLDVEDFFEQDTWNKMIENGKTFDLDSAISNADPYRGLGTRYLHHPKMDESHHSNPTGAVVVPISLATTFQQRRPGCATAPNDPNSYSKGYEYSRTGNPTRGVFERAVAAAENASYCVAFSSGSAATSAVLHLLSSGDNVLCVDDVYGGTQRYFRKIASLKMNISFDFLSNFAPENIKPKTKLIWLETPTNPTMKVTDIAKVAKMAHENIDDNKESQEGGKVLLAVDNTFCSPYFQNPLELGADLVVHSVTKYINGHSDVVMGVVCTNDPSLHEQLRFIQNGIGAVPSPFDCYMAHRGLKTLHLRMEASSRNAMAIAKFLEQHEAVRRVLYPGLPSHPQYEIIKKQQHGFGAMITFYCYGNRTQSGLILQNLKVFALAESLGAVESLAECPSLMTHASVPDDQRETLGIDDTLIRLSVGVESCSDLIQDLNHALNIALRSRPPLLQHKSESD